MNRSDKRKNLLQSSPDQAERLARIGQGLSQGAEPTPAGKKMGRPPGKRSNPDYQPVTTYLKVANYTDVQKALVGSKQDFGDIVDELLDRWLAENGHRK